MSDAYPLPADGWPMTERADVPFTPERFCEQYGPRIYRFAAMVARGDVEAEDLAQEALIRALRNLQHFDPNRGNAEAWLWRIVMNAARDAGRVAGRRQALWDRLVSQRREIPSTESLALSRFDDRDLLKAVRQLPKRDRTLLALRFGADLDYAAVGRASGLTAAAATMAIRRALAKLRATLEDQP
jgi:RNA polymerase sigma factor (sigma-70 family)